jgi:hypothetical protein
MVALLVEVCVGAGVVFDGVLAGALDDDTLVGVALSLPVVAVP